MTIELKDNWGVYPQVAKRLLAAHGRQRVVEVVAWGEHLKATKKLKGQGWVYRALEEGWGAPGTFQAARHKPQEAPRSERQVSPDPLKDKQERIVGLHAAAAGGVTSPPAGARWGRHREGGPLVELEDVNDHRVRCAGGSVIPAHHWGDWEWFTGHPDAGATVEGLNAPVAAATVNGVERDPQHTALAILTAWAAAATRTPDQVAAKLDARGVTLAEWEAYRAAQAHGG